VFVMKSSDAPIHFSLNLLARAPRNNRRNDLKLLIEDQVENVRQMLIGRFNA